MASIIALIPARAGSQRIPNKNIKPLAGHPLLAYTIAGAKQSGIFEFVAVSSDSEDILDVARRADVFIHHRKAPHATATSPDVEWVNDALRMTDIGEYFAILRPTSPFRSAATIRRAWEQFEPSACDCLRAVEPCGVNPYKMFWMRHCELLPVLPTYDVPPWHSRPTQTLPPTFQQNASLEMAKCGLVRDRLYPSITGPRMFGFLNPPPEGFDINTPEDWELAERKIASGEWTLPTI